MALPSSKSDTKFDIKGKHYLDDAIKEKRGNTGNWAFWTLGIVGIVARFEKYKIWGIIQRQKNLEQISFKQRVLRNKSYI